MVSEELVVAVRGPNGASLRRSFPPGVPVALGRERGCHVLLPGAQVSRKHVEVQLEAKGICVQDFSANGTEVDGSKLHRSQAVHDVERLELHVGEYKVQLYRRESEEIDGERRRQAHALLLERLRLHERSDPQPSEALRKEVDQALRLIVAEERFGIPASLRPRLVRELSDEALGLGPLEPLLRDPEVSEVMVVDHRTIYAERGGRVELTGRRFTDDEAVRSAIERVVTPLGRRIDESSPLVDARLSDGSRVNAVIPPLALRGPTITIRKFPESRLMLSDLVRLGSVSEAVGNFLEAAVSLRKNIVVSGGTGSGKTTLLNVLSSAIAPSERVITIEDAAELNLAQSHVVRLESKPPNLEGKGEVSIRELVKNALRMRPDRILVGECRGGEALDMLQAMNTGHDGSMTTTHANSPAQAVGRLETLCLLSGVELPLMAIRRQIAESVDVIVQQSRHADGRRLVSSVCEVIGLDPGGQVELRELFALRGEKLQCTGFFPSFLEELESLDGGARQ